MLTADASAGPKSGVWVANVERETGGYGLNAATGEMEDLVKAGVIDPAKVTRAALQNAASVAALVLTTDVLVADKREPKAPPFPAAAWTTSSRPSPIPQPPRPPGITVGRPLVAERTSFVVRAAVIAPPWFPVPADEAG